MNIAPARDRRSQREDRHEPRQDATLLRSYGLDAVWNDDFHHAARVAATGVADGYRSTYRGTAAELAGATRHGFLYQGQAYPWPSSASTRSRSRFPERLVLVNLGPMMRRAFVAEPLLAAPAGRSWRTLFSTEDPQYGDGTPPPLTAEGLALPARSTVVLYGIDTPHA